MRNTTLSLTIRSFAVAGAQARLAEISQEVEAIRRAFPELRQNGPGGAKTSRTEAAGDDEPTTRARRRRSTMSAAQRKAVGERMKKYWAARRGGSETTGTTSSDSPNENTSNTARGTVKRGARNMSPEARKRISDAQKARWAKQRGGAKATSASESSEAPSAATIKRRGAVKVRTRAAKRGPRKMSAAARKRMSQAQKKRWAAKRKAA